VLKHRLLPPLLVLLAGCHSVGPTLIERDHFDYNAAIANSWKEQMLLNMVRLRYGEAPVFLDVASVIAQYSLETQVVVNSEGWDRPNNVGPPMASGAARWIDRPTITYQPRTGAVLAQTLLQPVSLSSIVTLAQAGWPIDLTLGITLRSINGMVASERRGRIDWNPRFLRAVEALARVSTLGGGGIRKQDEKLVYRLLDDPASEEIQAAHREFRDALGLDPALTEYEIVMSPQRLSDHQLSLSTASALDVLNLLASRFDVPEHHVAQGWTFPTPEAGPGRNSSGIVAPIRVHTGEELPDNVFVATENRGWWFWIDDRDYDSKRAFSFLTMLLTLSESSSSPAPVVTIGAGGN